MREVSYEGERGLLYNSTIEDLINKKLEENYQRGVGIVGPSGYNRTRTSFGNATGLSLLPTWRIGRAILCYDLWPLVLFLKDLANL